MTLPKLVLSRFGAPSLCFMLALAVTSAQASEYSDLVTSYGPIDYWRLSETSGTTAVSTTGAHNGTYQNSVTLGQGGAIAGDANTAARFGGGANDRVQINPFGISGSGITILAWFKPNGFGNDRFLAKANGTPVNNHYWSLGLNSGTQLNAMLKINGTTQARTPTVTGMRNGIWSFAALTYDGSTMRTYSNGVQVDAAAFAGTVSNNTSVAVALGNLPSGAGNRAYSGVLDEVALFSKRLTAAEIYDLYIAGGAGLLGHWKLVETSGTNADDSSAQANDGVYTNGVVLASAGPYPGAGDKAANFDGSNDYVALANESVYDLNAQISVATWFKVDVFNRNQQALVTKGDNAWRLQRAGNTNALDFYCQGLSAQTVTSPANVNDGKWHHAVGVYTGSQLRIYIDGVLSSSVNSTGSINVNNRSVRIGANDQGPARNFDGSMHDVRIYSRGLSATDVAKLYGFIGHWKLSQTSGTSATDSTVFAANGTVSGGANWSTRCNAAAVFDFNGSSNYISIPNAPQLRPTSAMTVAAWVKGDTWGSGSDVDVILRKGDANPNNYQLAIADGRLAFYLDDSDSNGVRSNALLTAGQWYHVAAVWDGTTVKLYINGQLDNSVSRTGAVATDTRPLYIGGAPSSDRFDGMIHDVRFYNRAVNASDVADLSGQVGYWQFAEGAGTTAADSSGKANNATLSGGATWTTTCAGNTALLTNGAGGIAATATAFSPPDVGTVAFWMQSNGNPASAASIFGLGDNWEVRQLTNGTLAFDICADAGTSAVTTVGLNQVGRWYHVAITFDSATETYAIYLDGQLHKSGINSNALTQQAAAVLSFGTRTGVGAYWQGGLRDFRVYSHQLCAAEIAEISGTAGYWKLDETSGNVAADSSGAGRNGTVIGTPTWTTGSIDNALLVGSSSWMEVNSLLGSPKNVTISAWGNLTARDSSGAELISLGDYFAIRLDEGGSSKAFFYNGSGWDFVSVNQTFLNTGWHHFAAVFNDDQNWCRLYVDGVQVASTTTNVTIPYTGEGSKFVVGRHGNNKSGWTFTGKIDDARVYGRSLCASEIADLHDAGSGTFGGVKIIKWVEIQ